MMPTSLLTSVGRGYSDLCAAMCAVGTCSEELQIWKEVDGIFSADPHKIPSARLLPTVTLEEASELTYYGSEVRGKSFTYFEPFELTFAGYTPLYHGANTQRHHPTSTQKCQESLRQRHHYLSLS